MGCSLNYESLDLIKVPTRDNYIKIATLNYSGLNDSPYEFYQFKKYDANNEENDLNRIFKQLCQEKYPQFGSDQFQWSFKDVDRKYRKQRYSPLYNRQAGINKFNFLMSQQEFRQKWLQEYDNQWENKIKNIFESLIKKNKLQKMYNLLSKQSQQKIKIKQRPLDVVSLEQQNIDNKQVEATSEKKNILKQNGTLANRDKKNGGQLGKSHNNQKYSSVAQKNKQNSITTQNKSQINKQKLSNTDNTLEIQFQKSKGVQIENKQDDSIKFQKYTLVIELIRNQMLDFDFLVYKSILFYIYGKQKAQGIVDGLKQYSERPFEYSKYQNKKFSKSYLNQSQKFDKLFQIIRKKDIDILFIQDISRQFLNQFEKKVPDYRIVYNPIKLDSAIIINDDTLSKGQHYNIGNFNLCLLQNKIISSQLRKNQQNKPLSRSQMNQLAQKQLQKILSLLNINESTIIQFIENFILVSTHLTSMTKQSKKKQQQAKQYVPPANLLSQFIKMKKNETISKNEQIIAQQQPQPCSNSQYQHQFVTKYRKIQNDYYESPNQMQVDLLKLTLQFLKGRFPNHHVIAGGTLNTEDIKWDKSNQNSKQYRLNQRHYSKISNMSDFNQPTNEQQFKGFSIFPNYSFDVVTSNQRRTYMQAQAKKADKIAQKRKDYLISDIMLQNPCVCTINGQNILPRTSKDQNLSQNLEQNNNQNIINTIFKIQMNKITQEYPLMPNQGHPYGSYLIIGQYKFRKSIEQKISDQNSQEITKNDNDQ